jgi:peptidoglycan-associated lipoprotein
MLRITKYLLIAILVTLVAACATTKKPTDQTATSGAQSAGLGIEPQFDSNLTPEQQKMLAQKTVLFGFDKTDVQTDYVPMVQAHANYLQTHTQQYVLLAGNTDARGSREYNMGLGERRAQSVADILMANGVLATQIVKVSYGPEVPVACGNTEDAYAQNRRVDILYCETTTCQDLAKKYAQHKMCSTNN